MLLILSPNYKGEAPLLAKTASALGWDTYTGGWRVPVNLLKSPGAVYGEQLFCEAIAEQMGWKLLSNSLDWLANLPEEYVNRKISFTTLAEARKITEQKFIKPADDKCFTAKVYSSGDELPKTDILDKTPVLVSDVMSFTSEYRCVIKNRRVIAACCYWLKAFNMAEPQINKPENYNNNIDAVIDFLNKALQDERVPCAPGTVIDVARFKKDTYTILETNPIYASGAYGCELVAFLDAVKAACVNEV